MISRPPKRRVRFVYVLGAAPVTTTSPLPVLAQLCPRPPWITPLTTSVPVVEPIWLRSGSPPLPPVPLSVIGPVQVLAPLRLLSAPTPPGAKPLAPFAPAPPSVSGSA